VCSSDLVVTVPLAPEVAVEPVAGRDLVDVWVVTGGARAQVLSQVTFLRIDHRSVALTLTDPQTADLENARAAGELLVLPSAAAPVEFRPSP
jgi:hypothetical protein